MNSDTWKSYDTTDDHGVMAHTKMVQDVIDAAYNYGKQAYMQAHPEFLQVMQQRAEQQALHFQRHLPEPARLQGRRPTCHFGTINCAMIAT